MTLFRSADRRRGRAVPVVEPRQAAAHDPPGHQGRDEGKRGPPGGARPHPPAPAGAVAPPDDAGGTLRSEEHTSELQSLMRSSYAAFCLTKKTKTKLYM